MNASEIEHLVNSGRGDEVLHPKEVVYSSEPSIPVVAQIPVEPVPIPITPEVTPPVVEQSYKTGADKYAGDFEDPSDLPDGGYEKFDFPTPAHVLAMFNDAIISGDVTMHQWQKEVNIDLAPAVRPTSQNPLKYFLVAANGSGKDAFVIAPFAIWFVLAKVRSQVIITSASGTQLTAQTESYIRSLAERVNQKLASPIFKIRQRYIRCLKSGSVIRMFATDEAGKAEGYHPLEPNAEMAIIKNESKSIPEDIHKALKRCSGFNYWLEVSSPGAPVGAFYRASTTWKNGRRITSFDCPHISDSEREEDKIDLGENSAEYRSKHLALFTSQDSEVVIPALVVENLLTNPPSFQFPTWQKRVGIDLAAGGDETCLFITQGVKILKEYAFTEKDTTVAARRLDTILRDNGIPKEHELIYADDGGIGHAVIDMLNSQYGYRIKRVLNQSVAYNRKRFGNRGAEMWFNVKRLFEESMFDIRGISQKCKDQLCNRKYKQQEGGRLFLQSKRAAKSEGFHSPDRADALILSFCGLTISDFIAEDKLKKDDKPKRQQLRSPQAVSDYYDGITFHEYEMIQSHGSRGKKAKGSLQIALGLGSITKEDKYGITENN